MPNDFRTINTRLIASDNTKAGIESAMGSFRDFARNSAKEIGSTIVGGLDFTQSSSKLFEGLAKGGLDIAKLFPHTAPFAFGAEFLIGSWIKTSEAIEQANQKAKEYQDLLVKLRDLGTTPTGEKRFTALGPGGKQWLASMQDAFHRGFSGDEDAQQLFKDIGLKLEDMKHMTAEARFKNLMDKLGEGPNPAKRLALAQQVFGADAFELLGNRHQLLNEFNRNPTIKDDGEARNLATERELAQIRAFNDAQAAAFTTHRQRIIDARKFTEELESQANSFGKTSFEIERMNVQLRAQREGWEKSKEGADLLKKAIDQINVRELKAKAEEVKNTFTPSASEKFLKDLPKFQDAFNRGDITKAQFGEFLQRNAESLKPAASPTTTSNLQFGSADAARFIIGQRAATADTQNSQLIDLQKVANDNLAAIRTANEKTVDRFSNTRLVRVELR